MPARVDVDQGRGIGYGYKAKNEASPTYLLGKMPVSSFISGVYGRLQTLAPGGIVLDVGCGAGRVPAQAPQDRTWRVFGIDHDPQAIAQARKVIRPGDNVVVGDATRLSELGLPKIDAAVSHRVLHAIPPQLQRPIVASVADILPPGGEAFVSVASIDDWKAGEIGASTGQVYDCAPVMFAAQGVQRDDPFAMMFFVDDTMASLVQGTGLVIEGASTFTEPSGYSHITEPNTYRGYLLRKENVNGTPRGDVLWTANGYH